MDLVTLRDQKLPPVIYKIKLPQFAGPFDLLLFFIQRDEVDIYDIPIAKITADFLDYLHQMEILNIDLASEFILVASTLMRIKAKMLLPRKELDEFGEAIDPRAELVQRLLEYKRFKEIVSDLANMEKNRSMRFQRGNMHHEMHHIDDKYTLDAELESVSLFKLMKVFNKVLNRFEKRQQKVEFAVVRYPYTIRQQKKYFKDNFKLQGDEVAFEKVFDCENRVEAIFRFLAMLELMQERFIKVRIGLGINNFWVTRGTLEVA